jgi:hypothetical protein
MPTKPIVCTECGADRANKKWKQSGNQFAALLLVDDDSSPTPPLRTGAVTAAARTRPYHDAKPSAVESSENAHH